MPISTATYKRTYNHTKNRGNEEKVRCAKCGGLYPKWKTFVMFQRFRLNDPALRKQMDPKFVHLFSRKVRVCPKCARFYHVVDKTKSTKKSHLSK